MTAILLRFPHGLGDVVQFSVVLAHLRKYRPDWQVDVVVGRGKHTALTGQCRRVYHDQTTGPVGPYDSEQTLGWWENYNGYVDCPNSKITNCLRECFGLEWDASLGRYRVNVSDEATGRAGRYLRGIGCERQEDGRYNAVLVHYEGNTSPSKKCLMHWQAQSICDLALRCKKVPVVLDWDDRSPIPDQKKVFCPRPGPDDIWGGFGSGDAETIAALIAQSAAYIGIDSGPGKVASATNTPTLICWKSHHPMQFHDPAENTTHLVPENHRQLPPCGAHEDIPKFFEKHYRFLTYSGDHGLVAQAQKWLVGALNMTTVEGEVLGQTFVLPGGIGDCAWALTKIRGIASERPVDVIVSGDPRKEVDRRTLPFLKRFPFIRDVSVMDVPVLQNREEPTNTRGRYVYVSDGVKGPYHFLVPNAVLEEGRRLEDWLPEYPCDWDVFRHFDWGDTERGDELGVGLSPFVAFYLGPESGNVDEGHNRGFQWEPKQWVMLGKALEERGMTIAVVGAPYDRSYWERYVKEGVAQEGMTWVDLIGKLEIGETFALLKRAKCFISYQCGLGIVSHYFGQKVVMWWRGEGDSAHHKYLVSFSERMKDAWVRPGWEKNYYGAVYKRESVDDILKVIDERKWLD